MSCRALAVGAALMTGCSGDTGTISVRLATAPGSNLLDGVVTARVTLSVPRREVVATRDPDGKFRLALEVPADGPSASVTFEGEDAAGARIAYGCSGLLPIAAIDADVTIYAGAPGTLAAAPVALDRPRAEAGTAEFAFGVLIAGGRAPDGSASAAVDVYNVYSHRLQRGADLPAARRAPTVAAGVAGYAYVFAGADDAGRATATLWRFDTTAPPAGSYQTLPEVPALARIGARAATIRPEAFIVTGSALDAPVVLDGLTGRATALPGSPPLVGTASSITTADEAGADTIAMVAGLGTASTGLARITTTAITEEAGPAGAARTGHGAAVGRDNRITLVGGTLAGVLAATAVVLDPAARSYQELAAGLETRRRDAAVAQTGRHILVAGGRDAGGAVLATAEILDASSLAHVATVPMVAARADATAHTLTSGQILIVGGVDGTGAPVAALELFTPDPSLAFPAGPIGCGRP